jgi:hypothetical protein
MRRELNSHIGDRTDFFLIVVFVLALVAKSEDEKNEDTVPRAALSVTPVCSPLDVGPGQYH